MEWSPDWRRNPLRLSIRGNSALPSFFPSSLLCVLEKATINLFLPHRSANVVRGRFPSVVLVLFSSPCQIRLMKLYPAIPSFRRVWIILFVVLFLSSMLLQEYLP
ncbi:hypothetical protein ASPWEDRAFT_252254 [Aspergillus wentii DTO 134E9]|uniref:Uncharacterized protein n=1 Tax=Aspergillus wentii DTO 134E9 TaxID=1073089 RepID=A0A1L9S212_ASPWE|nr:uncharacterized protein ASPWEDRAFT_252254 [Aspergillus wentii DTO 134E9]OJJ41217.1 hypothetical protein ASPWEDRAFT_252254 [Aspergillus wentii DTO 134E9]